MDKFRYGYIVWALLYIIVLSGCSGPNAVRAVFLADKDERNVYELFRNQEHEDDRRVTNIKKISNQGDLARRDEFYPLRFSVFELSPDKRFVAYLRPGGVSVAAASSEGESIYADVVRDIDSATSFRWSPDSQYLAFVRAGKLHTVRFDVSDERLVSARTIRNYGSFDFLQYFWTPDSNQFIFLSGEPPNARLFSVNRDGRNERQLSGTEYLDLGGWNFEWYSAGEWVVYRAATEMPVDGSVPKINIYSVRKTGPVSRRIISQNSRSFASVSDYGVSQNGSRVAYISDNEIDGRYELYTVLPDGTGHHKISGRSVVGGDVVSFKWAPNSQRIAFRGDLNADEVFNLYTNLSTGGGFVDHSRGDGLSTDVLDYQWSPNSEKLAYLANKRIPDYFDLYVSAADSAVDQIQLTDLTPALQRKIRWYEWSPNSRYLGYVLQNSQFTLNPSAPEEVVNPANQLYYADVASTESTKITPEGYGVHFEFGGYIVRDIEWANSSDQIVYRAFKEVDFVPGGFLGIRLYSSKLTGEIDDLSGLMPEGAGVTNFRVAQRHRVFLINTPEFELESGVPSFMPDVGP